MLGIGSTTVRVNDGQKLSFLKLYTIILSKDITVRAEVARSIHQNAPIVYAMSRPVSFLLCLAVEGPNFIGFCSHLDNGFL